MPKSTAPFLPTTVAVLGLAAGAASTPGRRLLRAAQSLTPPGVRLDLLDLLPLGTGPGFAEVLWKTLSAHDALLLTTSSSDGDAPTTALLAAFEWAAAQHARSPLYEVPVAVLYTDGDPRQAPNVERLRQTLRAAGACVMPHYDLHVRPDQPLAGGDASVSESAHGVLRRLMGDMQVWAQSVGCGSILAGAATSAPGKDT